MNSDKIGIDDDLNIDRYMYKIFWSDDDQSYVGLCETFESLSWLADTPEDAIRGIKSLVFYYLKERKELREREEEEVEVEGGMDNKYTATITSLTREDRDLLYDLVEELAEGNCFIDSGEVGTYMATFSACPNKVIINCASLLAGKVNCLFDDGLETFIEKYSKKED